ncbi:MAG: peptidase M12 [Candidatus Electrothrix sp. AX2]|nr:peptidase M12 [Candidatus Electrothrix gigas]
MNDQKDTQKIISAVCTPRVISLKNPVVAAEAAIKINPLNRPSMKKLQRMVGRLGRFPTPEELAIVTDKYWGAEGVRLTVGFLDNPSAELRERILSHMNAWNQTANIEFVYTEAANDAQVRINRERMADDAWNGYWSFLGTDILLDSEIKGPDGPPNGQTMNLEGFTTRTAESEFTRVVRHETGHTLGCPHEHMREELINKLDRQKTIDYFKMLTGWSEEMIIQQVLTPLDENPSPTDDLPPVEGSEYTDPISIMTYQIPEI